MVTGSAKIFAQRRPTVFMIALTYAWSWTFFISAFGSWHEFADLRLAFFILGAFGPAVGGILTLRFQQGPVQPTRSRWAAFLAGAALAVAALILLRNDFLGVAGLQGSWLLHIQDDLSVTALALYLLPVLVSGWVFSGVQSRRPILSRYFSGLIPSVSSALSLVPLLFFLPALLISSNLVATLLGMEYQAPKYQTEAWTVWVPLMFVLLIISLKMWRRGTGHDPLNNR